MKNDLYILTIWKGVDPILTGSYKDAEAREQALSALKKEYGEESSYFPVDLSAGAQIEIGVFS